MSTPYPARKIVVLDKRQRSIHQPVIVSCGSEAISQILTWMELDTCPRVVFRGSGTIIRCSLRIDHDGERLFLMEAREKS